MQRIPIALAWTPLPVGVNPATLDQLGTVIAQYLSGQISSDVSFFEMGASDPTQLVTPLFFNTSQGIFKYWDVNAGRYLAVTPFQPGDTKNSFVTGDEIQQGWIVLDGREISAIQGISQNQSSVLQQLFGINGSLPTVTPVQSLTGLPAADAYSSIGTSNAVQPPEGQIGALPFGASYDPTQPQALATNTEVLRGSAAQLQVQQNAINEVNIELLAALRGSANTATLTAKVYAGLP